MLLLALDTSGRLGGITLARGNGENFEVIESTAIQGGTFSAELIPQISEILSRHGMLPADLEGLVAVTGPGSFTGLRVGLTAVKGLAEALRLPIASVTSLEILMAASRGGSDRAASLHTRGEKLMAVLDAGRDEVYAGIRSHDGYEELLMTIAEGTELHAGGTVHLITCDANLASKFPGARFVRYRSSEVAARVGLEKLLAGETVDVLALDANYIRKSEAEYMQKLRKG